MLNEFSSALNESPCTQSGAKAPHSYQLDDTEFWRYIPAWSEIDSKTFGDHRWQQRNSITTLTRIREILGELVGSTLIDDIDAGLMRTRMNLRLTPYVFSRINWAIAENDPVRRQFIPLGSQFIPDHPLAMDDSLAEESNKVTPYLIHRYPDKALFLPTTLVIAML